MKLYHIILLSALMTACVRPRITPRLNFAEAISVPKDAHQVYCGPTSQDCFDASWAFCSTNKQDDNSFSSIHYNTLQDWMQNPQMSFSFSDMIQETPTRFRMSVVCKP